MNRATAELPAIDDLDALFKGVADPTRIRILNLLAAGELCVCDIVEILDLPQSTVSRHLGHLLRSELVEVSRGWKFAHYRLAAPSNPVHKTLLTCVRTCFRGVLRLDSERARAAERVGARASEPC
jgi:ArsR family transcriptional regulator